jgi:hypothetical protein
VGKWAFFTRKISNRRKSAILGQKTPKKCHFQKMPPNFSAHFWFSKPGFCPLFLGFFQENCPYTLKNFSKVGFCPNPPNKTGLKFTQFSSIYGLISLISKPVRSVYQPE